MPLYDFRCPSGHVTEHLLREIADVMPCLVCGKAADRMPPLPHVPPDGEYSYEPNLGDPKDFERKYELAKENTAKWKG